VTQRLQSGRWLFKHVPKLSPVNVPSSAVVKHTVSSAPRTEPSRPEPVATHAEGRAVIQVRVVGVPPHPVVVTDARSEVGSGAVVVGHTGMFCCKQLSTFWPVRDDTILPTLKQNSPTPVPKVPSAV
jgi:hypothetical protein